MLFFYSRSAARAFAQSRSAKGLKTSVKDNGATAPAGKRYACRVIGK